MLPISKALGRALLYCAVLLGIGACTDAQPILLVDLRSDLVPGIEVTSAETAHFEGLADATGGGDPVRVFTRELTRADDLIAGVRIAEVTPIERGTRTIRVRLLDAASQVVLERIALVEVDDAVAVTILMTRDCRGVTCPAAGGDPLALACLDGVCVQPECTPERQETCPPPSCTASSDCTGTVASCATMRCVSGACLDAPNGACSDDEYCDPQLDCRPVSQMPDAGAPPIEDASVDAEVGDGGTDAGDTLCAAHADLGTSGCLTGAPPIALWQLGENLPRSQVDDSSGGDVCVPLTIDGATETISGADLGAGRLFADPATSLPIVRALESSGSVTVTVWAQSSVTQSATIFSLADAARSLTITQTGSSSRGSVHGSSLTSGRPLDVGLTRFLALQFDGASMFYECGGLGGGQGSSAMLSWDDATTSLQLGPWDGVVRQIAIYDRALSSAERGCLRGGAEGAVP